MLLSSARNRRALPPPAEVRGNDWRMLEVAPLEAFEPWLSVSVVIPYYERPRELSLTLAGLERQTYPRELFEVIVVDDGSDPPLDLATLELPVSSALSLRAIHQEDLGFGVARARNNGARTAHGDLLVFLDGDLVPEADWLAAHARWHHAADGLLAQGFCNVVDTAGVGAQSVLDRIGPLADLFAGRPIETWEWIERRMERTGDLTSDADDVFGAVTGGNLSMSKDFFDLTGGFDESFTQWGGEDTEFGWRACSLGAVVVPERTALCWHQGGSHELSEDKAASAEQQRDKMAQLIPHSRFRSVAPGTTYAVPRTVVIVTPGGCDAGGEGTVLGTVEQVLASSVSDMAVWVAEEPAQTFDDMRRVPGLDPRVRFGEASAAADAFPASAFHVHVPAGAAIDPQMLERLHEQLGTAVRGESDLASGHRVTITRAWAVHRARRSGRDVAAFGGVLELDADDLRAPQREAPRTVPAVDQPVHAKRPPSLAARVRSLLRRLLSELRRIRRPRDIARFVKAVERGLGRRMRRRRESPDPAPSARLDASEAEAAGSAAAVASAASAGSAPMRCVPAFDERAVNPIGWKRSFEPRLDSAEAAAARGATARKQMRGAHHVVDWTDERADPAVRAGELVAAAASGVVVCLRAPDPPMAPFLGAEMYGLMSDRGRTEAAGEHEREAMSIALRRAALRHHSLSARIRQVRESAGAGPDRFPSVSVLAPTRRPDRLRALATAVASQSYPRLELVVGLHGAGFEPSRVESELSKLRCPVRTVEVTADRSLGEVLNAAFAESSGELVAKIDDDDFYGPDHLWDLVLAAEYSGAALVGKLAWFVYLTDTDQTLRVRGGFGERYIEPPGQSLAGGSTLVRREALEAVGGWRPIGNGEDMALQQDVAWTGRRVFRTHGFGYVFVRHGDGHTHALDDSYFLDRAVDSRPGLDLRFAAAI